MNRVIGQCIALIFTACFIAMQWQQVDVPVQNEQHTFYIEQVVTKTLELGKQLDDFQPFLAAKFESSQQKTDLNQVRQYLRNIERQVVHPFQPYMHILLYREKFMDSVIVLIKVIMPWFVLLVFVLLSFKMIDWARKRKAGAITFAVLVQIFLPDPKAQITIEAVALRKQEVKEVRKQGQGKGKKIEDHEL